MKCRTRSTIRYSPVVYNIYIYIYTLILQIIVTTNYRDVFILYAFLSGGGSKNLKFKLTKYTNYRDVLLFVCVSPYTNYRDVFAHYYNEFSARIPLRQKHLFRRNLGNLVKFGQKPTYGPCGSGVSEHLEVPDMVNLVSSKGTPPST